MYGPEINDVRNIFRNRAECERERTRDAQPRKRVPAVAAGRLFGLPAGRR